MHGLRIVRIPPTYATKKSNTDTVISQIETEFVSRGSLLTRTRIAIYFRNALSEHAPMQKNVPYTHWRTIRYVIVGRSGNRRGIEYCHIRNQPRA